MTIGFLFSAIVAGQQVKESKLSSIPTIEKSRMLQNDSIAKDNINMVMKNSLNSKSLLNKYENNSSIQNNLNQLKHNDLNFNNTTNGSYISPDGKITYPSQIINHTRYYDSPGTAHAEVPVFNTK